MGRRQQDSATFRWPSWLNAVALLLVSFVAMAAISFHARADAEVVAVAFPPWWNTQQVFAAAASAHAAIVRTTAISSILVVRPGDNDGLARLREAGVWLTIDAQAIAACIANNAGGTPWVKAEI